MSFRRRRFILYILIPLGVLATLSYFSIRHFLDPKVYGNIFQEQLTRMLGRNVTLGKATVSFWRGVGIAFEDIRVKDQSAEVDLLRSNRVILRVELLPLIIGQVRWKRIVFERPILNLRRDKEGRFNLFDGRSTDAPLKTIQQEVLKRLETLFGGSVVFQDGEVIALPDHLFQGREVLVRPVRRREGGHFGPDGGPELEAGGDDAVPLLLVEENERPDELEVAAHQEILHIDAVAVAYLHEIE